jgi:uncharacterized coiled-coil protein SlyX
MAEPTLPLPQHWNEVLFGFVLGIIPRIPGFFVWLGKRLENNEARSNRTQDALVELLKSVLADQKATITELKTQNLEQAQEMEQMRHAVSDLQKNAIMK